MLLLEIDPQNVDVDSINNKTEKCEPANTICQEVGIKIAHTADISNQPKLTPLISSTKPPQTVHKMTPKSSKTAPMTNGVSKDHTKSPSPSISPPSKTKPSDALTVSTKLKISDNKPGKAKTEKSLNPIKISIPSGSIIRYMH